MDPPCWNPVVPDEPVELVWFETLAAAIGRGPHRSGRTRTLPAQAAAAATQQRRADLIAQLNARPGDPRCAPAHAAAIKALTDSIREGNSAPSRSRRSWPEEEPDPDARRRGDDRRSQRPAQGLSAMSACVRQRKPRPAAHRLPRRPPHRP